MLGEIAKSASLVTKLIRTAETIEDQVERARVMSLLQQLYVLHFSPTLTKALLQKVSTGSELSQEDLDRLDYGLHSSRGAVEETLSALTRVTERHGAMFSPSEREQLMMIGYGKSSIRRDLQELVQHGRNPQSHFTKRRADALLLQMEQVNQALDLASGLVRERLVAQAMIRPSKRGGWFWAVIGIGLVAWTAIIVCAIVFAGDIRSALIGAP